MNTNYLLQYDQVIAYYDQFLSFANEIARSLRSEMVIPYRNPKGRLYGFKPTYKQLKQMNPLSGRNSQYLQDFYTRGATAEQKENQYFQILNSEYPMDSLASGVLQQFPDFDFETLKKVHETKKEQLVRGNVLRQAATLVLASGTILLRSIPKSVVERFTDYASFELNVFMVTLSILAFLVIFFLPIWVSYNRAKWRIGFIGDILTYATLKQAEIKK